jgi:hypothetical protein
VVDYAVTGATIRVSTFWEIKNGAAKVRAEIFQDRDVKAKHETVLPARVGLRTVFDAKKMNVEWFGSGPWENYSDRMSSTFLGKWSLSSDEFFFPYDVPQDCGNREGTYSVKLATGCDDVTFTATGEAFAFEVNPYAPETLVKFAHPAELPKSDSTFFGIYAKVRGLGGNSCGPRPLPRDIVGRGPYTLEFVIK